VSADARIRLKMYALARDRTCGEAQLKLWPDGKRVRPYTVFLLLHMAVTFPQKQCDCFFFYPPPLLPPTFIFSGANS
jgi:hypothetical protein